jgi:hypothetical protein
MNISPRFTEFGMTGAFFWIGQIIFFGLAYNQGLVDIIPQWVMVWDGYQTMLPEVLQQSAGTLLTVFGVIGIFITGLILDLTGSVFSFWETYVFNHHLRRNRDWLNNLADQCPENIKQDYRTLRDHIGTIFMFSPQKIWERFLLVRKRKHIQTFLFSYIHVFSSMPEILVDDMHLYRTSRTVSFILLILATEITFTTTYDSPLGGIYVVAYAFLGLSALITLSSYNRLCFTLFSLACATREKQPQN